MIRIYTIGFAKKGAARFFQLLRQSGIKQLIDVRLHNSSQLSGFAKKDDLQFFLKEICNAEYRYESLLAPSEDILTAYKKNEISWAQYEDQFRELMKKREIVSRLNNTIFRIPTVLLCSEDKPTKCHRRLIAEHLKENWGDTEVIHL
jgi:uncharacterized protein (DUF488 family)